MSSATEAIPQPLGYTFLPSPQSLVAKLNSLDSARNGSDQLEARRIEQDIVEMVSPGLYEGYPYADLRPVVIEVIEVVRVNSGANLHTFSVRFRTLDDGGVHEMDLVDFLKPVYRPIGAAGRVHSGPKFWQ